MHIPSCYIGREDCTQCAEGPSPLLKKQMKHRNKQSFTSQRVWISMIKRPAVCTKWLLDHAWCAVYISVTAPYAALVVGDVGSSISPRHSPPSSRWDCRGRVNQVEQMGCNCPLTHHLRPLHIQIRCLPCSNANSKGVFKRFGGKSLLSMTAACLFCLLSCLPFYPAAHRIATVQNISSAVANVSLWPLCSPLHSLPPWPPLGAR